jgi:hypothetical protein
LENEVNLSAVVQSVATSVSVSAFAFTFTSLSASGSASAQWIPADPATSRNVDGKLDRTYIIQLRTSNGTGSFPIAARKTSRDPERRILIPPPNSDRHSINQNLTEMSVPFPIQFLMSPFRTNRDRDHCRRLRDDVLGSFSPFLAFP